MNRPSNLGVDVAEPWCFTAKAPLLSQGSSAPRSHRLPGRGRLCNSGKCGRWAHANCGAAVILRSHRPLDPALRLARTSIRMRTHASNCPL